MKNVSLGTPVTNRGVVMTKKEEETLYFKGEINDLTQFVFFDWFQFTIHLDFDDFKPVDFVNSDVDPSTKKIYKLFKDLFNINENDLIYLDHGVNGYTCGYEYNNIKAYYNFKNYNMGINFILSGQGCREFDRLGLSYKELITKLNNNYIVKYNRIDISIDDFTNNYFTLDKIKKYVKNGLIVSKFRTSYNMNKIILKDYTSLGDTVQFGSRASLVQITFYDKLKERQNNNYLVADSIKYWVRCETRYRDEKASEILDLYVKENKTLNELVKGVLHNYIRFIDKPDNNDSKKNRWPLAKWYNAYLENIDKLKFLPPMLEPSITKKKSWIVNSTSKSNFMVLASELDNSKLDDNTLDYIFAYLQQGFERITDKDMQTINNYRLSKKMQPITRFFLEDYIRDFKDQIIYDEK